MDTEPEAKKEKTYHPFYCNICKIACASALNLQTHFLGYKHKTVEEALKAHGIVKTAAGAADQTKASAKLPDYVQTEPERFLGDTLEEQIDACKDSEPALGLDYIVEYRSKENLIYECELCDCQTGQSNMFMHVFGAKHRLAYLKAHYPNITVSEKIKGRGSVLNKKLKDIAANIEKKEGRKQIKVVVDLPAKRDWQEYDSHFQQIPASNEIWFSKDDKGFQDEKEENKTAKSKSSDKPAASKVYESSKDNKAKCDGSKKSEKAAPQVQNTEQQKKKEVISEEFGSQEELLGYLQSFEILNEDDASFILKVTQKLTGTLVKYRQKFAPEKTSSDSEPNQEETTDQCSEQPVMTSVVIDDTKTGFSTNDTSRQPPVQQLDESMGAKSVISHSLMTKDAPSTSNYSRNNASNLKRGTFISSFREINDEESSESFPASEKPPSSMSDEKPSLCNPTDVPHSSLTGYSPHDNSVIAEFFSTIRNMHVGEVTATLQKIAATNPAFKGMDIPNVIRILTESGTLRAPANTSTL